MRGQFVINDFKSNTVSVFRCGRRVPASSSTGGIRCSSPATASFARSTFAWGRMARSMSPIFTTMSSAIRTTTFVTRHARCTTPDLAVSYKKTRSRPSRHSPRAPPASCSTCSRRPSAGPGSRLSLNSVNATAHRARHGRPLDSPYGCRRAELQPQSARGTSLCATAEAVSPQLLERALASDDHRLRAFAARLASRWQDRLANTHELLELAANDAHPQVRLEAILSCGQVPQGGNQAGRTGGITAFAGQMDRLRLHAGGAPSGAPLDDRADRGHASTSPRTPARCLPCSRKAAPNRCSPA